MESPKNSPSLEEDNNGVETQLQALLEDMKTEAPSIEENINSKLISEDVHDQPSSSEIPSELPEGVQNLPPEITDSSQSLQQWQKSRWDALASPRARYLQETLERFGNLPTVEKIRKQLRDQEYVREFTEFEHLKKCTHTAITYQPSKCRSPEYPPSQVEHLKSHTPKKPKPTPDQPSRPRSPKYPPSQVEHLKSHTPKKPKPTPDQPSRPRSPEYPPSQVEHLKSHTPKSPKSTPDQPSRPRSPVYPPTQVEHLKKCTPKPTPLPPSGRRSPVNQHHHDQIMQKFNAKLKRQAFDRLADNIFTKLPHQVLQADITDLAQLAATTQRMINVIFATICSYAGKPLTIHDHELYQHLSVGLARFFEDVIATVQRKIYSAESITPKDGERRRQQRSRGRCSMTTALLEDLPEANILRSSDIFKLKISKVEVDNVEMEPTELLLGSK